LTDLVCRSCGQPIGIVQGPLPVPELNVLNPMEKTEQGIVLRVQSKRPAMSNLSGSHLIWRMRAGSPTSPHPGHCRELISREHPPVSNSHIKVCIVSAPLIRGLAHGLRAYARRASESPIWKLPIPDGSNPGCSVRLQHFALVRPSVSKANHVKEALPAEAGSVLALILPVPADHQNRTASSNGVLEKTLEK
jgi:hypothetical protein